MVHNKNQRARDEGALARLKAAKFTPKTWKNGHERTEEQWRTQVDYDISVIEKRLNGGY